MREYSRHLGLLTLFVAVVLSVACSGNSTVGTAPPTAAADYQGFLDFNDCKSVAGWVWDRSRPNTPIDVEINADEKVVAKVHAALFRQDLLADGKGDGKHGFVEDLPASVHDGSTHTITVKVAGSNFGLTRGQNAAATITCGAN